MAKAPTLERGSQTGSFHFWKSPKIGLPVSDRYFSDFEIVGEPGSRRDFCSQPEPLPGYRARFRKAGSLERRT
jgi:hypothetical protein